MLKITEENYTHYKKVAEIIWGFQFKYDPMEIKDEELPINVLNTWEQKSLSLARKGLKAALIDSLSALRYAPENFITALNEQLIKSDLPTLNKLLSVVNDVPARVIKRGTIKNLNEYYIIKEILDDVGCGISEADNEQLNKLFGEFEIKFPNKKKDN